MPPPVATSDTHGHYADADSLRNHFADVFERFHSDAKSQRMPCSSSVVVDVILQCISWSQSDERFLQNIGQVNDVSLHKTMPRRHD